MTDKSPLEVMLDAHEQLDVERFKNLNTQVAPIPSMATDITSIKSGIHTIKWFIGLALGLATIYVALPHVTTETAQAETIIKMSK